MRGAGYLAAGAVSGWRSGTSQNRMIQGYIRDCWGTERLTRASSSSGNRYAAVFFQFGLKRFALHVRDWETDQVRTLTELLEKLQTSMVTVSVRERPPASGRRWAREMLNRRMRSNRFMNRGRRLSRPHGTPILG